MHRDLRLESARRLMEIDAASRAAGHKGFQGFGIGGYSVGEPHDVMFETLGAVCDALPQDRPRYLMGVGNTTTFVRAVREGVDMFDCVLPTRTGRMGTAFSHEGRMNLRNAKYKDKVTRALGQMYTCPVCTQYTRAYLRHLVMQEGNARRHFAVHSQSAFLDRFDGKGARGRSGGSLRGAFAGVDKLSPAANDYSG